MARRFDVSNPDVRELVLQECGRVIADGGLLVIPTDTVYGVACDAFSASGVAALLAAKGRGRDMPPPVLVGRRETLFGIAEAVDQRVVDLSTTFWPGPLTIICRAQPSLDWDLGETHGTVAVRMPDEETTLELLQVTGPLAVSSANLSGRPAALDVAAAEEMLGDTVDVYIDAGPRADSTTSTIIDMTSEPPRILRPGPVTHAQLAEIVPDVVDFETDG